MMYYGKEGYVEKTKEVVRVARRIASEVPALFPDDFELTGDSG